jgi:hypothetical protein
MARRDRARVDLRALWLVRVAPLAGAIRDERGLVHRVTIETAAGAPVLGLRVLVTGRALANVERRRLVRTVAIAARLIAVCADRRNVEALRLLVATHAARRANREIGAEAVAVLTGRRLTDADRIDRMQRCLHAGVTRRAQICGGHREAGVAVTVPARHMGLRDMDGVTCALADVLPRHGYLRRRRTIAAAARRERERDEDQPPHRAPIG